MKELFSIDLKDYNSNDSVFRRPSARAIIIKNNIIALVYSVKEKYYKFPGGGIKDDEDMVAALAREVKEEVGLIVKTKSISEFGSVMRRQKSNYTENTIFEQENYYFWCECEENVVNQNLDDFLTFKDSIPYWKIKTQGVNALNINSFTLGHSTSLTI